MDFPIYFLNTFQLSLLLSMANCSSGQNPVNFVGRSPKWPRNSFHWFAANETWKLWRISPSVAKLQVHFCFSDELLTGCLRLVGFIYLFVCFVALRFFSYFSVYFFFIFLLYAHEEKLLLFALCCLFCLFSTVPFRFSLFVLLGNSRANNPRQRIEEKQNVSLSRVKYIHKFRPLIACNVTLSRGKPPSCSCFSQELIQYFKNRKLI